MTDVTIVEGPAAQSVLAGSVLDAGDEQLVRLLAERAEGQGIFLAGEGGLLAQLTKLVLEAGLEAEMTSHLGYDKHDPTGRDRGNSRNGVRAKTVITEVGPVQIEVPRDRDASFEPVTVPKRVRRLRGVDEMVIALVARGMSTGDVQAHLAEVYGTNVSRQQISTITDAVVDKMAEWASRPLDAVYPVVFIDAIDVKIRDGQVANRPIYVALAVTCDGERDVLGLWAGEHGDGEGAKYWMKVLTPDKEPGRERRVHARVRRAEAPALRGGPGLAPNRGAGLHRPSPAQQLPVRVKEGLVCHRQGPQAGLHGRLGRDVCPRVNVHAIPKRLLQGALRGGLAPTRASHRAGAAIGVPNQDPGAVPIGDSVDAYYTHCPDRQRRSSCDHFMTSLLR